VRETLHKSLAQGRLKGNFTQQINFNPEGPLIGVEMDRQNKATDQQCVSEDKTKSPVSG